MKPGNKNSFKSLTTIKINSNEYSYYSLKLAEKNLSDYLEPILTKGRLRSLETP